MYNKAKRRADYLGITFHEYIKHLIAQDITMTQVPVVEVGDDVAEEVLKARKEYAEGKFARFDPRDKKQLESILD